MYTQILMTSLGYAHSMHAKSEAVTMLLLSSVIFIIFNLCLLFFLTLSNCCPFFSVSFHVIHGIRFTPFMLYSHCLNIFFNTNTNDELAWGLLLSVKQRTKSLRDAVHAWNIPAYFVFQWAARMWVTVLDGQMRSLFLIHLELWVLWKLFMWSFCCIESAFRLAAQRLLDGTAVLPLVLWVKCNQLP